MKKILLILLLTIFFIPNVDAAVDVDSREYANLVFEANEEAIYSAYNILMESYKAYKDKFPYYHLGFSYYNLDDNYHTTSDSQSLFLATLYYFKSTDLSIDGGRFYFRDISNLSSPTHETSNSNSYGAFSESVFKYNDFRNYASNIPYVLGDGTYSKYYIDTINNKYTEVNLDNYEYVILNLKNYSKKEAFDVNLQVKGMVGITPVYEFGTAEKESVTDRCNVSYSDYTDYRLYILKNDLLNNAVYYVKACEEGSSFKFDNTIFSVTYVTTENVNDPVITFDGVEYHAIPFDKLSSTANKNEEENFVPGASGSSLTDVIDNITNYISSFWNSLSTFMGLVTKFFNMLPVEIRAICITTFATACTLGLLKILKS